MVRALSEISLPSRCLRAIADELSRALPIPPETDDVPDGDAKELPLADATLTDYVRTHTTSPSPCVNGVATECDPKDWPNMLDAFMAGIAVSILLVLIWLVLD